MKRTNSIGKIMLVVLCVSAAISFGIAILEAAVGADKVFLGAILLLPIVFVWMLITDALVKRSNKKKG